MKKEFYMESCGAGELHVCCWEPDCAPKGVVQIIHGIAEHIMRYEAFAEYLNTLGYVVVGEDHMGHGGSIGHGCPQGYFAGGWNAGIQDVKKLMEMTQQTYSGLPYILFGHSMGSFMARTFLINHPDSGIDGCIICGTAWMPEVMLLAGQQACRAVCKFQKEQAPSELLEKIAFGSYNNGFDHPRTDKDWVNRDPKEVDAYIADPWCGFTPAAGLFRDMMGGIRYNQQMENLGKMQKNLPVHFIAGGDDPVGDRGKGVHKAAEAFRKAGMEQVTCRIYPLCRHEILREINKEEVFNDIAHWLEATLETKGE